VKEHLTEGGFMRKVRLVGSLILLTLFAVGCGGMSFKKAAYIAVDTSKTFYETSGPTLALLHKEGKISDADKDKAIEYGHQFAAKWEIANAALKVYKKIESTENASKFQTALDAMEEVYKIFKNFYLPLVIKKEEK
jgi:hypothetical protein